MKVIISGGGTGGHIFPAIAIADALKVEDPNVEILFVGAKGKMEMTKIPAAGYKIKGLNVAGFHRKQLLRNLSFPFKLMSSMWAAVDIVRSFKPDIVVGVGGYASGPTLKAASWLGVPTVLQEQNSYAGVTNKLLAKKAKRIYVAYKGMDRFFDKKKIEIFGNPVRLDVYKHNLTIQESKDILGVHTTGKVVLVSGGSLGARSINEALAASYNDIKNNPEVFFYWQVGKLYFEEFQKHKVAQLPNVMMVGFIENMAAAYKMAEVVVCRAGALTISELTLTGNTAILIPSPNVAEDHQTHNAMSLVDIGAAVLVKDVRAKADLSQTIFDLLNDEARKASLREKITGLGTINSAEKIAKDIIRIIN